MSSVYVGTYAKYNNGSIQGKWLDLEDYDDLDEFLDAARELHSDEDDPELMFQDYDGFPAAFYNESYLSPELWDEWINLSDDDRELIDMYKSHVDIDGSLESARDVFMGVYDSPADWAETYLVDDTCALALLGDLTYYFDFEAYARDARGDFVFALSEDGKCWVFSSY